MFASSYRSDDNYVMPKKQPKVIYYTDELNDDFANKKIKRKEIPNDYKYVNHSWLFKVNAFLLRYLFAIPILWMINTFIYRPKIVNKEIFKLVKKKGYFIYSNHVLPFDPVVIPIVVDTRKPCLIISSHELFSINKLTSWMVRHFFAIPVPNADYEMNQNFVEAIKYHLNKQHRVLIYPEAHIWPYYKGIRHFKSASFRYPVDDDAPVIVMTTTFKKRKGNRKPKPIIYVDGPFYKDETLSYREQISDLAERAYQTMLSHSQREDNFEYIKYIKKSD